MSRFAGLAFVLLGILGVLGCGYILMKSMKVRGWPVARGRIVEKSVGEAKVPSPQVDVYFEPRVKYEYAVDGRTYTGDRVYSTHQTFDRGDAQKVVDRLPPEVDVYYDPGQPAEAYLFPTSILWPSVGLAGGLLMLLFGLIRLFGGP